MQQENIIRDILGDMPIESEMALLEISDKVFIDEPLAAIKAKASEAAFIIFIGTQTIGCWKSDGWPIGIFGNFPEIVPYIPDVMRSLKLENMAELVGKAIHAFPDGTDFSQNDQAYCDVINFLGGLDKFIKDKSKFERYPADEKTQIRENYHNAMEQLEAETVPLWGYGAPDHEGWGVLWTF